MSHDFPRRRSLDSLKKEAKRWLAALRSNDPSARERFARALKDAPAVPTLRDVQLALAREHGFAGWVALKETLTAESSRSATTIEAYEQRALALLEAYRTGTPEAMERHYRFTWHRRAWQGMRTYVQLDLGKRPAAPGGDVDITMDDARFLVAVEHGFENWNALHAFVAGMPAGTTMLAKPMRVRLATAAAGARASGTARDWQSMQRLVAETAPAALDGEGQMTDAMLADVAAIEHVTALNLSASRALTDDGLRQLARLPNLRRLDLSATNITDRGLSILRELPSLEWLSLVMTSITDAGAAELAHCDNLEFVALGHTATGDGAIRALAGKRRLREFRSGDLVTDDGLAALHHLPVFQSWQGGEVVMRLLSGDSGPNHLLLRGPFTDQGMKHLQGLDGLFGLNLDARELGISAAAMVPLISLPRLGWLSVDAKDDWMPHIARMPHLRYLAAQDTEAGDDGFVALSRSKSIECIWGRQCHNLQRRGFLALAEMPSLRGLSVSCLNVDDTAIAALPQFPALTELMPMDIPDAGYRHVGRCAGLESLILMYCRNTTDAATEQITGLSKLTYYYNSYTTITDRTPELLSTMDSLERITFDGCHGLTDAGVSALARLPRLSELRVSGRGVTPLAVVGRPEVQAALV